MSMVLICDTKRLHEAKSKPRVILLCFPNMWKKVDNYTLGEVI